MFSVKSRDCK